MDLWIMLERLVLAMAAGALVGLEREHHDRPAGLRTHMLVCSGSALFTLVSFGAGGDRADPTRIAAQIVTGIGFLGAGTIFRYGAEVRGLTTAAGMWVMAGIGMGIAVGGALMQVALIATLLVFLVNSGLRHLEARLIPSREQLRLRTSRSDAALARVFEGLEARGVSVLETRWMAEEASPEEGTLRLRLRLPPEVAAGELTAWLTTVPGVTEVTWE